MFTEPVIDCRKGGGLDHLGAALQGMKRILVIEDDSAVRGLIVETLEMQGWQPLGVSNGTEGITAAARELPDLILCDIQMPEKDGFEVLQNVRKSTATATTPFIFLTGLGDKPKMRQAMELGADDYLIKPFTVKELVAAVEARFQKQDLLARSSDQKLEELRGSLSFALPHELVTPLNSILGFSSLILESDASSEVKEYASLIHSSGERLKTLAEKFLLYAQLELTAADPSQRAALANQPSAEIADTISTAAERSAKQANRESDLRLEAMPAEHCINASHLTRIVQELLENAFKFSEPGTAVLLRSGPGTDGLFLEVMDHGRGFSTEQIARVGAHLQFDRKLTEQQGTGLGLAICRRIAELYGGDLQIQSMPGAVTRVIVRLPDRAAA